MYQPLLGFDRERWERRKSEARAQWERERTRPARTIKTQTSHSVIAGVFIRDPDEIHTDRPIPQKEIDRVIEMFRKVESENKSTYKRTHLLFEIGFKLRCWQFLMSPAKWLEWRRMHLNDISGKTIRLALWSWDNNEKITNTFANGRNLPGEIWKTPYYLSISTRWKELT